MSVAHDQLRGLGSGWLGLPALLQLCCIQQVQSLNQVTHWKEGHNDVVNKAIAWDVKGCAQAGACHAPAHAVCAHATAYNAPPAAVQVIVRGSVARRAGSNVPSSQAPAQVSVPAARRTSRASLHIRESCGPGASRQQRVGCAMKGTEAVVNSIHCLRTAARGGSHVSPATEVE